MPACVGFVLEFKRRAIDQAYVDAALVRRVFVNNLIALAREAWLLEQIDENLFVLEFSKTQHVAIEFANDFGQVLKLEAIALSGPTLLGQVLVVALVVRVVDRVEEVFDIPKAKLVFLRVPDLQA